MPAKRSRPLEVPAVRIVEIEAPTVALELLGSLLREINPRQWGAVLEVLLEAKFKAEAMLRNDAVFDSGGRPFYYQGWVAYSDYIISELERLRSDSGEVAQERHEGPPED